MTYSVHQHWDPLKVCAVGRSYPPEFYSFIKNRNARSVMERIAEETEEDYQSLIKMLHGFGVDTVRTQVFDDAEHYVRDGKMISPPMTPRDYTAMIGNTFYMLGPSRQINWSNLRGEDWPEIAPPTEEIPQWIRDELKNDHNIDYTKLEVVKEYEGLIPIEKHLREKGIPIHHKGSNEINSAMITRVGKDLYHGTDHYEQDQTKLLEERQKLFPNYRNHVVNSGGHSDGTFCPVKPGLIISLQDIPTYKDTFPDWEVVYLPGQSWEKVKPFLDLKRKNKGKFWVPGEEYNDEFTEVVNTWLGDWVGYVEETVFDVNMLVIDEKNVICNNENDQVFEAFARHGVTPHVCNFRHRYFWDGGIHCITSDLHREGTQQDYFPNRS